MGATSGAMKHVCIICIINVREAGSNGSEISSTTTPPPTLSLEDAMQQLNASPLVPDCIKWAFGSLVNELRTVRQERDQLREENRLLREQLAMSQHSTPSEQSSVDPLAHKSEPHSLINCRESERQRSIIIAGIPESKNSFLKDRLQYDYSSVMNVLYHLNVECYPLSVYRLDKPKDGMNRLLKVVLPTRFFQCMAVQRAFWLSSFLKKGIFLRDSLTASERERRKKARLDHSVSNSSHSFSAQNSQPKMTDLNIVSSNNEMGN
ncbi:hypothetical protein Aduo_006437 [Ancylostoma duodenale]